jgi:hypothetical protein
MVGTAAGLASRPSTKSRSMSTITSVVFISLSLAHQMCSPMHTILPLPFDWPGRPMSTVSLSRVAPCRVEAHQMPSLRMNSSMLTSLKVTTRTLVTKRAGRYMSHTQASCRVMSK